MTVDQRVFLDVKFHLLDEAEALAEVLRLAALPNFSYVATPNVDHVVQLHRAGNRDVRDAYEQANLSLCDSRILHRLARLSGMTIPVVTGSDLTRNLLEQSQDRFTIALIGGDEALHRDIAALYPRFDWQFFAPPMNLRRDAAARAQIATFVEGANAQIILFATGAPQSEITCAEIKQRGVAQGVALCVGASLEFLTGAKRRAPLWMQRSSLEWLYRLLSEPRRLWRRYLIEGPKIFSIWLRWRKS